MPEGSDAQLESGGGLLVVVSGPSGVGKTTIARSLVEYFDGALSVSVTTRPQAPGEVDGRDYYFRSRDQFEQMVGEGKFLEYANVFGDHSYGTPREPVVEQLDNGRIVVLEIDVQGALQVKERMPDAFMIFIRPPNNHELLRRLRARGRDSEEAIEKRFSMATREIAKADESMAYNHYITNDALDLAVREVCDLVAHRRSKQG